MGSKGKIFLFIGLVLLVLLVMGKGYSVMLFGVPKKPDSSFDQTKFDAIINDVSANKVATS